ncbi:GDP-mannose 4,6-dehydratase [Candidatus Roizmanbacteria bacterium CG10_big_fil_rev_8_21_14_0_10_45_7]|uniref:GDP-mannose 4,6-dehydratase n=1 Tax=Candidatus Roizmanbacteria bacterium CG10_big_fil_rev_8_21_14_0_10_45_7 TaxID=1974854 RepID=A0A2M8KU02_9BACT|nr:MAG: GDP-mannose 4,6-dehydratase [Candidatus Roizmanbacteria bacterium CG10_big_fil_rev_8_21_14_0_10_45_7]
MKKILITGAGGFAGTYLIKELQKSKDFEIYGAVYKSTSDISSLLDSAHILEGDLTDFSVAEHIVKVASPHVIYHLAAISVVHSSARQTTTVMNSNTTISYNILESVRQFAPHARFIAISSGNVYGAVQDTTLSIDESTPIRPLNPYAISKVTQEMLALQYYLAYGLDVVILRPFNHTGPGQTTDFVIPRLADQFARIEHGEIDPVIEVGNLDTIRDFTDVSDMVIAYTLATKDGKSGEIYNIGSGTGHSIHQILMIMQSLSKTKVEVKINQTLIRTADVPILICDASKFQEVTGWKPTISFDTTISAIIDYWRRI